MIIRNIFLCCILLIYGSCEIYQKPIIPNREFVQLKSIYHHTNINGPLPNQFQRMEVPAIHQASSASYNLKHVLGTTYHPSDQYKQKLYNQGKSRKLLRSSNIEMLYPVQSILPDVTDHASILSLGEMSYNAYTELGKDGQWYDLGSKWRIVSFLFIEYSLFTHYFFLELEFNIWMGKRWFKRSCIW